VSEFALNAGGKMGSGMGTNKFDAVYHPVDATYINPAIYGPTPEHKAMMDKLELIEAKLDRLSIKIEVIFGDTVWLSGEPKALRDLVKH
jgi:hypothetical protein